MLIQWLGRAGLVAALTAALLGASRVARAGGAPISFQLVSTSLDTTSGGTVTFEGMVTNNSGQDLVASDFSFNFSSFDVTSVFPTQDFAINSDSASLLLPSGSTSPTVALFDITLGPVAPPSSFTISVQLQDDTLNSDLSEPQNVLVNVPGSGVTPEPASLLLVGSALVGALVPRRKRKICNTSVG
jgi:hypothetical protein